MANIQRKIENLKPGKEYLLTVRAKNADINVSSDYAESIRFKVPTDQTIPGTITGFQLLVNFEKIMFVFNINNDPDLKGYEYEVYDSDPDPGPATPIYQGFSDSNIFTISVDNTTKITDDINAPPTYTTTPKQYWGRVRMVDTSGNYGPWSTYEASGETPLITEQFIAELTASKITTGTIGAHSITLNGITSIIKSSNYLVDASGWKISGDGNAEFNNVKVRGEVNATDFNLLNGSGALISSLGPFVYEIPNTDGSTPGGGTITGGFASGTYPFALIFNHLNANFDNSGIGWSTTNTVTNVQNVSLIGPNSSLQTISSTNSYLNMYRSDVSGKAFNNIRMQPSEYHYLVGASEYVSGNFMELGVAANTAGVDEGYSRIDLMGWTIPPTGVAGGGYGRLYIGTDHTDTNNYVYLEAAEKTSAGSWTTIKGWHRIQSTESLIYVQNASSFSFQQIGPNTVNIQSQNPTGSLAARVVSTYNDSSQMYYWDSTAGPITLNGFKCNNTDARIFTGTNGVLRFRIDNSGIGYFPGQMNIGSNTSHGVALHVTGNAHVNGDTQIVVDALNGLYVGTIGIVGDTLNHLYSQLVYDRTAASGSTVIVDNVGRIRRFTSSARYKKDITAWMSSLDDVLELRPVTFRSINDVDGDALTVGFIAEEVEKITPEVVLYGAEGSVEGINYNGMIAMLVNAVKDLSNEIEVLKKAVYNS